MQESTRFSPNYQVFGHTVRSLLAILQDDLAEVDRLTNSIDYVNGFGHRLFAAVEQSRENLNEAQSKMKVGDLH